MINESIKVSAHSSVNSVAGAIAAAIRDNGKTQIQVVGAGALNQAVKAVIIARGYLAPEGKDLTMVPSFQTTSINGDERTLICLDIEIR